MKDDILIRYINKHCTATEEKEVLEWLKEKDSRQRLFELEQIWGLKTEMRFSDKGRMDEAYRQLSGQLGLSSRQRKERNRYRDSPSGNGGSMRLCWLLFVFLQQTCFISRKRNRKHTIR